MDPNKEQQVIVTPVTEFSTVESRYEEICETMWIIQMLSTAIDRGKVDKEAVRKAAAMYDSLSNEKVEMEAIMGVVEQLTATCIIK